MHMKSGVIGRGTPYIVSSHMPTQEETIAAMELLRQQIKPPTVFETQIVKTGRVEGGNSAVIEVSHDPLSGHMTKTKHS